MTGVEIKQDKLTETVLKELKFIKKRGSKYNELYEKIDALPEGEYLEMTFDTSEKLKAFYNMVRKQTELTVKQRELKLFIYKKNGVEENENN